MRPITNTLFVGKELHHLKLIDSTNSYVINLLSNSKPSEGLTVFTDNQVNGRGQIGTIWTSEPKMNIATSILLYPKFLTIKNIFYLNKSIAIAVRNTIAHFSLGKIEIKWPNDIYLNGKKVAGILIETALSSSQINYAIIGVGINVNQEKFDQNLSNASSLFILNNMVYDLELVMNYLCEQIEKWYLKLKANKHTEINTAYFEHFFGLNIMRNFQFKNTIVVGKIIGVDENGKLMIEINNELITANMKEISFLQ